MNSIHMSPSRNPLIQLLESELAAEKSTFHLKTQEKQKHEEKQADKIHFVILSFLPIVAVVSHTVAK